jgi:hypothetical protein
MERGKKIDPVLKEWLDKVLVPVMVQEYLAMRANAGDNGSSPIAFEDSDIPSSGRVQ